MNTEISKQDMIDWNLFVLENLEKDIKIQSIKIKLFELFCIIIALLSFIFMFYTKNIFISSIPVFISFIFFAIVHSKMKMKLNSFIVMQIYTQQDLEELK